SVVRRVDQKIAGAAHVYLGSCRWVLEPENDRLGTVEVEAPNADAVDRRDRHGGPDYRAAEDAAQDRAAGGGQVARRVHVAAREPRAIQHIDGRRAIKDR